MLWSLFRAQDWQRPRFWEFFGSKSVAIVAPTEHRARATDGWFAILGIAALFSMNGLIIKSAASIRNNRLLSCLLLCIDDVLSQRMNAL
jgi:hypothetical protein